jgi:hypothetical protein
MWQVQVYYGYDWWLTIGPGLLKKYEIVCNNRVDFYETIVPVLLWFVLKHPACLICWSTLSAWDVLLNIPVIKRPVKAG